MEKICKNCKKTFLKSKKESYLQFSKRINCSILCQSISSIGRKATKEHN
jgi:hypothetical protein